MDMRFPGHLTTRRNAHLAIWRRVRREARLAVMEGFQELLLIGCWCIIAALDGYQPTSSTSN
jgi:hypothetical protein